jgi:hypothetical protein
MLAGFVGVLDHLIRTERFRGLIRRWVEIDEIEEAIVPFGATATDALSGEAVLLRSGDVIDSLVASSPSLASSHRCTSAIVGSSMAVSQPAVRSLRLKQ